MLIGWKVVQPGLIIPVFYAGMDVSPLNSALELQINSNPHISIVIVQ